MRKLLSEYFSDDEKCSAKVFFDNVNYFVVCITDTGTTYKSMWDSEQLAENFAEDWVLKCQNS